MSTSNESIKPQVAVKSGQSAERSFGRAANWTVGVAAGVLVLISVGGYFYHREQLSAIAADHLRLIVTGPASVPSGDEAEYTVSTTAISGQPLPTQIEAAILGPDGRRLKVFKESADEHGRMRVAIPADLPLPPQITLKVTASHRESQEEAELPVSVAPVRYATHLTLDRSQYRPGEAVFYRSLTLSQRTLTIDQEMPIRFEIRTPDGSVASGSSRDATTRRGVANGQFAIPNDATAGQYLLTAQSPDRRFPTQQQPFFVLSSPTNADEPDKRKSDREKSESASTDGDFVLSTGTGVFAAEKPLEFGVRASQSGIPMIAAAYCRGIQVGQQPLVTGANTGRTSPIAISLQPATGGAIRLKLFDYSTSPPQPAAEQWVYRQRTRKINVRVTDVKNQYAPGEDVELAILTTDEMGRPVPAALSVSLVDVAAAASPGRDASAARLFKGVEGDEAAALAFDLLLDAQSPQAETLEPPLVFDNLGQIRSTYEESLATYRADRTKALNTLTTASFFGGLGLVLLVAMLGLMRIVSGMHLWIPAVGATTCCLIMGAILMDPGRLATGQDMGVPFSSYLGPSTVEAKHTTGSSGDGSEQHAHKSPRADAKPTMAAPEALLITATPYWNPLVIANAEGKATVRFKLPEVPSTFRLTIDAHDAGRIGAFQTDIVSGKADAQPQAEDTPAKPNAENIAAKQPTEDAS